MFGIGFSELVIIGVILIVAVGPKRMPGTLKAVVRAYREFRRATRELRASTGIDDLLRDEELQALRKPLYTPPVKKAAPRQRSLTYAEREREDPPEGVDLREAHDAEERRAKAESVRASEAADAELASTKVGPTKVAASGED